MIGIIGAMEEEVAALKEAELLQFYHQSVISPQLFVSPSVL